MFRHDLIRRALGAVCAIVMAATLTAGPPMARAEAASGAAANSGGGVRQRVVTHVRVCVGPARLELRLGGGEAMAGRLSYGGAGCGGGEFDAIGVAVRQTRSEPAIRRA